MATILAELVVVLHGGEVHADQPSGLLAFLGLGATVLLVALLFLWRNRRRPPQWPNP